MLDWQKRLHNILDYGGHLVAGLLLSYGAILYFVGRSRDREFSMELMLWALGIWVISRVILYVLSGHIPYLVTIMARLPWLLLALVAVPCAGFTGLVLTQLVMATASWRKPDDWVLALGTVTGVVAIVSAVLAVQNFRRS